MKNIIRKMTSLLFLGAVMPLLVCAMASAQVEITRILNPIGPDSNGFGLYCVSTEVCGDVVIIGAQYTDFFRGAAYIYCKENGEWVLKKTYHSEQPRGMDLFGSLGHPPGDAKQRCSSFWARASA